MEGNATQAWDSVRNIIQLFLLHGFASETFSREMDRLFNDA